MYQNYIFSEGRIIESDASEKNGLITVIDPTEDELRYLSENYNLDINKLKAATDLEEPSRWEKDGRCTYLIVDVPFKNDEGNFDTTPMMLILKEDLIVVISERPTGIIKRMIDKPPKGLNLEDKLGFEIQFLQKITYEYQQDLKEIDLRRREVEKKIKMQTADDMVGELHDLENSLVYFITSLKGCNIILELIKNDLNESMSKETTNLLKIVKIENQQAIEMASVYKEILGSTRELLSTEIDLKLNRTMKVLTAFTMMLTVPMVVTGAYGMNVELPIEDKPWAFAAIILGTGLFTTALTLILRKKKLL